MKLIAAVLFSSVGALLLNACTSPSAPEAVEEPIASAAPSDGRMSGYVMLRRYQDRFNVDGQEVVRDVEYGWDYARGMTVLKMFDTDGRLVSSEDRPGESLRLNEAENARAEALVRTHPQLEQILNQPGDTKIWIGGFILREPDDPFCKPGSRCVHVIASKDQGNTPVAHAIVDLMRDRVVYPFYHQQAGSESGKRSEKSS